MKLSFKFKIATLSFAVSGALLAVFGLVFFVFVYQSGIDRMDREIRTIAESSLHGARPPEHWRNFDQSLKFIYSKSSATRIMLRVARYDGNVIFQSENVLPELTAVKGPDRPVEKRGSTADHFHKRLDRDRDGRIAPDEFDGPPQDFPQLDRDNDGFISIEESASISRPRRGHPPMNTMPKQTFAPDFQTLETTAGDWRLGIFRDPQLYMTIAMDMNEFYSDIDRFRLAFMIAVPAGLLVLGFMGWFLADRAMRPVAVIADTAEGITAKGLDRRIPMVGTDIELERLVTVSNNMLDRLEKSYHQAVRFSADAAHELQTPLTILQGELDNAIQTSETGSTEQQRYSMLLEELRNLKAVVQKLLLLSHADEGRLNLNPQSVNLSTLVAEAAEDIEIIAPELKIQSDIENGVHVSADPALLNQILRNMVANAAKYSSANGTARFSLKQENGAIQFTLANTAPPIPEEDRPLLFERFHRVEKSRSSSGSGLGLSLAREIARSHGGDLMLNPYKNGMVSFTLTLPLA